jgi:prolipoprotein diacylglyceryltransferase
LAGIAVLLLLERRFNLRWGRLFALYLVWYSTGRFFIEAIRLDPSDVFFGLRTNQISALVGVLVGLALFMIQRARHTGEETTGYLPGRSNKALEQAKDQPEEQEETADSTSTEETEVGLTDTAENK